MKLSAAIVGRVLACSYLAIGLPPQLEAQASSSQVTPPKPLNSSIWINSNDYPGTAIREGGEGTVQFAVTVGVDGRVQRCDIIRSSGRTDLDEKTCAVVTLRARFSPALDAQGKPTVGVHRRVVTWKLPDEPLPVATTTTTAANGVQQPLPVEPAVSQPVTTPVVSVSRPPIVGGPRFALVVGNSQYTGGMGALANPVRDAQLVAQALQRAGFSVEVVTNANQRSLKAAIARFGQRLLTAGKQSTGLFYYAGHGVQSHGANYLIPIDAAIETEADVDLDGVSADTVIRQMAQAGVSTSIVILDACRNMPLTRQFRAGDRGLARMEAPNGSYIAYSTAPGQTAADGNGANSPFALALVTEMAKRDEPIESMFRNVRNAVFRATNGKQTPWDSSSLFDSFVFTPSPR